MSQKVIDLKANEIIGKDKENTFIAYDNGKIGPCIGGYIRVPHKDLLRALKRKTPNILIVDEFKTTKLCSKCNNECNTVSKDRNRFQVCHNCKRVWNRDINASRNILFKALHIILKGTVPKSFLMETKS